MERSRSRHLPPGDAKTLSSTQVLDVANAVTGANPMNLDICTPTMTPVVVVATHEELVRSARDLWVVAASLITELTPDKFATAPWAAGLFTVELPFILAKLWHLQQGIITSAHSYMETESMLTTVIETIDVPKLLRELGNWVVELGPLSQLPLGFSQHVPTVGIMPPSEVNIIKERFDQTNWSSQPLIRQESYQLVSGQSAHWFYLPSNRDWAAITGTANQSNVDVRLSDFVHQQTQLGDQILYVGNKDGQLVIPDAHVLEGHLLAPEGKVTIFQMSDLENSKDLEKSSTNE